jgi:hypothetical protein
LELQEEMASAMLKMYSDTAINPRHRKSRVAMATIHVKFVKTLWGVTKEQGATLLVGTNFVQATRPLATWLSLNVSKKRVLME